MSIQTIEEPAWEASAARAVLRRSLTVFGLAMVVAGPFVVGGAIGWMLTREPGPILGEDGWLRMRPAVAGAQAGAALISATELKAAGLSVENAGRMLLR